MQFKSTLLLGFIAGVITTQTYAIPSSYGAASHDTKKWQELSDPVIASENGVTWSSDNGLTWGREELFVGQTVQFRFNMHKRNVGTHYADLLKAWVDWGQDGAFDATDQVAYGEHIIAPQKGVVNTAVESGLGTNRTPDTSDITFFSNQFQLTAAHVGETWIRARVTCSHSIVNALGDNWDDQWNGYYKSNYENLFNPTGHYYQGETEQWKLTVSQVSEPATLALLGFSLAGIALIRRRTR